MACVVCRNLKLAFEARNREYSEARADVYYQICTRLAASIKVEMERAREELEEHWLACASTRKQVAGWPVAVRPYPYMERGTTRQAQSIGPSEHSIVKSAA